MASKRAEATAIVRAEDAKRSFNNWMTFNLVSLRHKCNAYSLSEKGQKKDLAKRLIRKLATDSSSSSSSSSSSDESTNSPQSSDTDDDPGRKSPTPPKTQSGPEDGDIFSDIDPDADAREMENILNYDASGNFSDDENNHKKNNSPAKTPPRAPSPNPNSSHPPAVSDQNDKTRGDQSKSVASSKQPISA